MYNYDYIVYFDVKIYSGLYTYNTKQELLKNWSINNNQVKNNIKNNEIKIFRKNKKNKIYYEINIYKFFKIKKEDLKNV